MALSHVYLPRGEQTGQGLAGSASSIQPQAQVVFFMSVLPLIKLIL